MNQSIMARQKQMIPIPVAQYIGARTEVVFNDSCNSWTLYFPMYSVNQYVQCRNLPVKLRSDYQLKIKKKKRFYKVKLTFKCK